MNLLSKIIFTTISASLIIILIFVTYLTNTYNSNQFPFYENIVPWTFELSNKNGDFTMNELSKTSSWKLLVKILNSSDKIYYSSWEIEINETNWVYDIKLSKWVYFFDFKKLNSRYVIKWEWFEINNKWHGKFIINNLVFWKSLVFSINSLVELNLKNYKTWENMTSLDLYPHTYLIFNPLKNVFVKNSDLLKISQNFVLSYFTNEIYSQDEISNDFLNIVSLKDSEIEKNIKDILTYEKNEYNEKLKTLNIFKKSSFSKISWEDYIVKYSKLFINESKISTFNKNIIIRNLNTLLKNESISPEDINKIVNTSKELKNIDPKWFEEIKNIINYYYDLVLTSDENINTKINLSSLISNLNDKNFSIDFLSLSYLEKTFFEYDFISNEWFYKNISDFRMRYFDDLNINLNWENSKKYNLNDMEKVDYLLFFLENIIINSDFSKSNIDTKDLITIFSDYVNISNYYYNFNDEKIKRTWIFTNSKLLFKFLTILENKYFDKDRNENWLLVLKQDEKIITSDIKLLEYNIDQLLKFYSEQKSVLDSKQNTKDQIVMDWYKNLETTYKEYFDAIKNYKEYTVKYDKNKNSLLTTESVWEGNNTIILSENNAKDYLSQFNWTNLSYTSIRVMDYNYCQTPNSENDTSNIEIPYCYKVENINIDWKNVSFLLFPLDKNKIDEIVIENIKKSSSYKLDEIKVELDEKYKIATLDKEKYDFANFMINTFWQKIIDTQNWWPEIIVWPTIEEDPVIKIFKRNKLLWASWDFSVLNWFLNINYNDLIVNKEANWEYSINLKSATYNIDIWRNNIYHWNFSSKYDFSNKHSFINPEITLIDKNNNTLLFGNKIYIKWEYKVTTIKEEIKKVFENYSFINEVTNSILNNLNTTDITINYYKTLNQTEFNTIYNWKNLYIKLFNWNITNISYNKQSLINGKIILSDLNNILKNINN